LFAFETSMKKILTIIQGPVSIGLASIFLAYGHMIAKLLTNQGFSGLEATFIRSSGSVLLILFLILFKKISLGSQNIKLLLLRGISGGIALVCLYTAIQYGSYANANALNNSYPIFVNILAFWLLKEKITWKKVLAILIAFAGVYLVVDPNFGQITIADVFGLASALFSAIAVVMIRILRKTDDSWGIVFSFFLFSMIFSTPAVSGDFIKRVPEIWLYACGLIFTTTFGQLLITRGYKKSSASSGSVLTLLTIIWGNLFSFFILQESLSMTFWIGSLLILFAGIAINWQETREVFVSPPA